MSKKGLLLGSVLADAFSLGAHWIYDCDKIKQNFGEYDRLHDPLPGSFHKNRSKGEHTHYGDQTLLLLEFFAEKGEFNTEKFKKFWYERMEKYDGYLDHATKESLSALKAGSEWGSSSTDLAGASRIAPVIYCNSDRERGVEFSVLQTKVTHNNQGVLLAAEFFAKVAYEVLEGKSPKNSIEAVTAEMNNSWITANVNKAVESLELSPEEAVGKLGQACTVSGAFPATIYIILKYEDNYRSAMIANVMAGGDSAARGLLAGMIIGAYREDTIPKEWLEEMCSLERVHF